MISNIFGLKNNLGGANRIEYIDFLRGLAIILVILHHVGCPNGTWIISFHLPLFFILSGYTSTIISKQSDIISVEFLKKKFLQLIIPYFTFELFHFFVTFAWKALSGNKINIIYALRDICLCWNTENYIGIVGRLWFLPCMFICDIVVLFLNKYIKNYNYNILFFISIIFFIFSWLETKYISIYLPFTMGTCLMAIPFKLFGIIFSNSIDYINQNRNKLIDFVIAAVAVAIMYYTKIYLDSYIYMYSNTYGEYLSTICCALSGSIIFFVVAKYLYIIMNKLHIKNFIKWYGFNSLIIFPIHLAMIWYLQCGVEILNKIFNLDLHTNWLIKFVFIFIVNIPVANVISNYFPFMIGKRKNDKK